MILRTSWRRRLPRSPHAPSHGAETEPSARARRSARLDIPVSFRNRSIFNGLMFTCWMGRALPGDRELKPPPPGFRGVAHEPLTELLEHDVREARACESGRLRHAAGSAVLRNPP